MSEQLKVEIPENHQDICREFASLAKKFGLGKLSVTYRPGYQDPWGAEISMAWEAGRHEDSVDNLSIQSTLWVRTKIKA